MPFIQRQSFQYVHSLWQVNRNCQLSFIAAMLNGLSHGIFLVIFNLYILELGITPDVLGGILSAAPLAQALGSIPIGFLAEKIGFRTTFVLIYAGAGLMKLVQVSTGIVAIIAGAAFLSGLALAGDFVARIAFLAANSRPEQRTRVYSLNSLLFSLSLALGSLVAGWVPNLFLGLDLNLLLAYRYTLYIAGVLSLLAAVPCLRVVESVRDEQRRISLSPYLWGMDRFTKQLAVTSLFVGLSIGMLAPFMNIYFLYHLGSSREFFGTVSAFGIVFIILGTAMGPWLGSKWGWVPAVTYLRLFIPISVIYFSLTRHQYLGAVLYWAQNSLFQMSQPLSFAFAMRAAAGHAQAAASAWLNVTFWLGNAIAAPVVGSFLVRADYRGPLWLAAGAILVAAILNHLYFNPLERAMQLEVSHGNSVEIR